MSFSTNLFSFLLCEKKPVQSEGLACPDPRVESCAVVPRVNRWHSLVMGAKQAFKEGRPFLCTSLAHTAKVGLKMLTSVHHTFQLPLSPS